VASIPPQEMMSVIRWLVPYMNAAERVGMLLGMKANAPAFQAALETVRPHLSNVSGRSWSGRWANPCSLSLWERLG
jgi:hypothetical protein